MNTRQMILRFAALAAVFSGCAGMPVLVAAQSFTISASNATMPTSGAGSIPLTLTSVNGFAGSVAVSCGPASPPTGSILPQCNYTGGAIATPPYTLTANGTVTGSLNLVANIPSCSGPCPVKLPRRLHHERVTSLALAGVLLLGLGFRRKALHWIAVVLISFVTLGINACASSGKTLTPGTFAYTVTGLGPTTCTTTAPVTCTALTVNTTVNVTVPDGISTNLTSANP